MNESLLVNTLGHSAGVLIFGIFLYLLIQDRAARRLRGSTKSMLAAALALAWNLASLLVLGTNTPGSIFTNIIVAIGFSVLSLLPAVLFDLCLQDRYRMAGNGCGYELSAVAIVTACRGTVPRRRALPSARGLQLITVGFGLLTCIAAVGLLSRRVEDTRRANTFAAGRNHGIISARDVLRAPGRGTRRASLVPRTGVSHHAAIPLALLVLMQDYRFVLLDAFLRFLANVLLAAIVHVRGAQAWSLGWLSQTLRRRFIRHCC